MHSKEDCLKLIAKVRSSMGEPESAYLLRSRVKRSVLSAARFAAMQLGTDAPVLPKTIDVPIPSSGTSAATLLTCNRLIALTRELCQPSEALDSRWRQGWKEVLEDLTALEKTLEQDHSAGESHPESQIQISSR